MFIDVITFNCTVLTLLILFLLSKTIRLGVEASVPGCAQGPENSCYGANFPDAMPMGEWMDDI